MATLQKIRNRGPLLLVVIGLALLAFILGDAWKMINPNSGMVMVGEVDGKSISALDYQEEVENYASVVKFSTGNSQLSDEQYTVIKDEVWATMVRKMLLEKEAEAIGLTVTNAEVMAVVEQGTDQNLLNSPFVNPQTGEFDVDVLTAFLASYNELDDSQLPEEYKLYYENLYNYWLFVEANIKSNLLYSKYASLIEACLISNPVSQLNSYENRMRRNNIVVAALPYSSVADSLAVPSSSDIKRIYNEKKELVYQQAETRDIFYIDYAIQPSSEDRAELEKEVKEYAAQLEEGENIASVIRLSESLVGYSQVPRSLENLPVDVAEKLENAKVGEVIPVYYNDADDSYNTMKLLSTVNTFDSLQISQIQVPATMREDYKTLSDSIYKAVSKGADMVELAAIYGQDGSAQWLSSEDYDVVNLTGDNAIYLNSLLSLKKKGEVTVISLKDVDLIVKAVDLINPVKKYEAAVVKCVTKYSVATSDAAYNKLSRFVALNNNLDLFKANAEKEGFGLLNIPALQSFNYYVGGVSNSHDALRWIFEAQEGQVSRIYEAGSQSDHLLVVGLNKIYKKGYRPMKEMVPSIMPLALKEKKAGILAARLSGKSMAELATMEGVELDTLNFMNFTSQVYLSPTYSTEPLLAPSIWNTEVGALSAPIVGEGGVFVAQKLTADSRSVEFEAKAESERIRAMRNGGVVNGLLQELYKLAKVEDTRYKTF